MTTLTPSSEPQPNTRPQSGSGLGSGSGARSLRPSARGIVAGTLAVFLAGGAVIGGALSATADTAPLTQASGVEIFDIDGGTLQAKKPLATWSSGATVRQTADSTGDVLKLNTTRTSGLVAEARADGASAMIASGEFTLRNRVPVVFTGLSATCDTSGGSAVDFSKLTVDGVDITASALATPGFSYALPDSIYGPTRIIVGERTVAADGRQTTTALRVEGESGASEIWRVRAGQVTCGVAPAATPTPEPTPAPTPAPVPTPAPTPGNPSDPVAISPQVSGVRVTAPDGTELIDGKPSVTRAGATETADLLQADSGFPATARDVTVATGADGSATASVSEFSQVPDRSELGEYRWNALRVYGLELAVKADGTSSVSFANPSSAVFVNGVWINTATDLYTGVDAAGTERVRVHLNERVQNADGSTTITALRYEDLTHANPDVRLGSVVLPALDPVVVPPSTGVGIASTVGVLVTSPTGEALIDGQPRVDAAGGSVTSALVAASQAFPARAKNVTVTADKTGAAVSLDEFTQVPDTSAIGEYVWSALRVYGLNLAVAPDGSSTVTFDNVSSAVFVNGVWINTATDLYTGVDAAGAERVRVHLNERVQNADGSTTITALHYEDLTGTYPDVRLGIVTVTPASTEPTPDPAPEPTPPPGHGGTELPARHAYGVQATGPSVIDAAPLASAAAATDALVVGDGAAGQVSVVAPSASVDASRSEVTTGPISLYPGTTIAVDLAGLTVVTTPSSIEVSSLGGTIGDTAIAAGPIAPNTVVALPGSNVRVVLNEQILTADEATVIGVHVSDAAGLGADVRVGAITSAAIEVAPVPDPSPTPGPSTPGTPANPGAPGSGLMPGALTPDSNSPAGTSGTNNRGLAATGAESGIAIGWAAAGLIVAGFGALALAKRRRGTPASRK
ncbi:hypothetical protein [Okibacterium fritillariae]|uniref:Uncharacterized protein n=1 Tax=Okibacterium fritillariae TaxID=123320 RepID=A0A1T5ICZ3_9MICO|nr:hypothetical protein [Okibacterium fritillariae]SKC36940.1 hypothetical protein SAMN06309945_0260 [Okibacterium fritillariae]